MTTRMMVASMVVSCACSHPVPAPRHDSPETAQRIVLVGGEPIRELMRWDTSLDLPVVGFPTWLVFDVPHPSEHGTEVNVRVSGPDNQGLVIETFDERKQSVDLKGRTTAQRIFVHVLVPQRHWHADDRIFLQVSSSFLPDPPPHRGPVVVACDDDHPDFKNPECCNGCGHCNMTIARFEHGIGFLALGPDDHVVAGSPGVLFTTTNEYTAVTVMSVDKWKHEAEFFLRDRKAIHIDNDGANVVGGRVVLELPPECFGQEPR